MAGISNLPFRLICQNQGSSFTTTEEISAKGLFYHSEKTKELCKFLPEEKPIAMQLFGSEPLILSKAAQTLQDAGADIIDLNMGCPVKKVTKTGAGAALMKDPVLCKKIFQAMRKVLTIPFTIKIRGGWDEKHINATQIAQLAENEGIDAITVHPRTRSQSFSGKAPWEIIKDVVDHVKIPVTGNGDVTSYKQASEMVSFTGCQDVMIGRGALGSPWVFNPKFEQLNPEQQNLLQYRTIKQHINYINQYFNPNFALIQIKKHLSWYSRGLVGSASFRKDVFSYDSSEDLIKSFEEFWPGSCNIALNS